MIRSFITKSKLFYDDEIILVPENKSNEHKNFYTVLIGNNGTGKSTLLSEIARRYKNNRDHSKKIIAISSSISDKFPHDKTFKKGYTGKYREMDYIYLGLRARNNLFSSNAQFRKALDILVQNYGQRDHSKGYRHVFDYLGYQPIIKINYRLLYKEQLESSMYNKFDEYERFNNGFQISYEDLLDRYEISHDDVLNFIRDYPNGEMEDFLIFNFSSKNVDRIANNYVLYEESVLRYKVIEILRMLKIIRQIDVKIFKKDGFEVDFREASSGEIAILSTLFSLIPIVEDESIILIDEPEISLHPYWQSKYIPLLTRVLDEVRGCHIIIATHSHLMLSDLPYDNSSIVSFKMKGSQVISQIISDSTYGYSAENILLNIFDVPSTRNYYFSKLVSSAIEMISKGLFDNQNLRNIIIDLKKFHPNLKDEDPFKEIVKSIIEVYDERQ